MLDLQRTGDVHLARQGHKKADQYAFVVAGRMCVCDGSEQVTCTGGVGSARRAIRATVVEEHSCSVYRSASRAG